MNSVSFNYESIVFYDILEFDSDQFAFMEYAYVLFDEKDYLE